ncbi:phospholipase-like protein [Tanacetum coccineum]|uniref:Phospholipase-like protein n=1 Tax=Tanacetum coccineum TaxID=301880 RepID=A0ABQ5FKQ6_9ASTR
MESLYGFRSIHGANCTVGLDIEMTRHREEVEEEKWWSCGGGGVAVRRLWFRRGGVAVDPPVALTLRSKLSLIKSLKDDTEAVPFTYTINGHEIQFGREEFCLITGLRFGVEFSDDYLHGPLDLRRRVWESHVDGNNIIGQMLIDKILSEEFYSLRDEDVVAVCLLAVLHMVLLGQEPKNNVPKWWLSLVNDINMWEKYPWGSYKWPKLYRQLKDANPKRWERFYASLRGRIRRPAKYTLSGFTWAFKTWILEAYKERALNYYTHVDRHPRAVAWVNGETFYRSYLEPFFEGAEPIRRLRADAFEAKAEWWVSSRAFFDGHICEPPQIPTAVSNDLYQRVAEHNKLIKELQQQNVDQYKIMNSMNKNFKEGLNASSMPGPMKAPFEVREHFGLSDLSGFQNTECGPQLFTTQASGSFLEGTHTTPTYPRTPHIGTPMSQPGFASCSSRYLPSHPGTPLTVLMALQEAHDEEACLEEQILSLMHRFADRFTNRRAEINRLVSLPNHQLIEYGRYALGCMTGADMKKATYLKSVRDELLRSMEEKRQLIKNYKEM